MPGLAASIKNKELYGRGVQNASLIDDTFGLGFVEMGLAILSHWEGDAETSLQNAMKSLDCFKKIGSPMMEGFGYLVLCEGYYLTGDYDKALDGGKRSVESAESMGIEASLPILYKDLAVIYAAQHGFDKARRYITQALELSRSYHQEGYEGKFLVAYGEILREEGIQHFDEARDNIRQGLSIAQKLGLGDTSPPRPFFETSQKIRVINPYSVPARSMTVDFSRSGMIASPINPTPEFTMSAAGATR